MSDLISKALKFIAKDSNNRETIVGPYDTCDDFYFRSAPDFYGKTFIYKAYYIAEDFDGYKILVDVSGDCDRIACYL
jgi:hypothetical protein